MGSKTQQAQGGREITLEAQGPSGPPRDILPPGPDQLPPATDPLPRIEVPFFQPGLNSHVLTEPDTGRSEYAPGDRESVGGSREIDIARMRRHRLEEMQKQRLPDESD